MTYQLEELCRPLLLQICEYYQCAKAGAGIKAESLKWDLQIALDDIRRKCENDLSLQREFQRIEQPLVFFIDYTIKEGHFPFSAEWQPIARTYNELSGDEKFFDQLAETLDDPDSAQRLRLFYMMMGLGFDGCYKGDSEYVERRMKLCGVRSSMGEELGEDSLLVKSDKIKTARHSIRVYSRRFWIIFGCCLLLAGAALVWNIYDYTTETAAYRKSLRTVQNILESNFQVKAPADKANQEVPEVKK